MFKSLAIVAIVAACCLAATVPSGSIKYCLGKCPAIDNPDQIVLLIHTKCEYYCKCEAGCPEVHQCRKDWYFSKIEGTCVPEEQSRCQAKI